MTQTRFPKTPHLPTSVSLDADDIKLSEEESDSILDHDLVVQEKLDGLCIGFSFNEEGAPVVQDRNSRLILDGNPFFKNIDKWQMYNFDRIFEVCLDRYTLFGEWLFWKHTVRYDRLPSFFIAHDIYDKRAHRFLSTDLVQARLAGTGISANMPIYHGKVTPDDIAHLISRSHFGPDQMEGLYLRLDSEGKNVARCKYVSDSFKDPIKEHWRSKPLVSNHSYAIPDKCWSYKP